MSIISPSRLAVESAGLTPHAHRHAEGDGICAMCGYPFRLGDPVLPFEPTDSFADYAALRAPTSRFIDGWCGAIWTKEFTQDYGKAVICEEGVFLAASNNDIAWFMLNPPEGRWIFVHIDQKRQHIIWRAPVNTSREIFFVQYGELRLTVRRQKLIEARDACKRLALVASEGRRGVPLKSPFARLSRDLNDPAHGALRHGLWQLGRDRPDVHADLDLIASLTPGEIWGLTAVLYVTDITRPQRKLPAI